MQQPLDEFDTSRVSPMMAQWLRTLSVRGSIATTESGVCGYTSSQADSMRVGSVPAFTLRVGREPIGVGVIAEMIRTHPQPTRASRVSHSGPVSGGVQNGSTGGGPAVLSYGQNELEMKVFNQVALFQRVADFDTSSTYTFSYWWIRHTFGNIVLKLRSIEPSVSRDVPDA